MHPGHYIQLSSPDAVRVERSLTELEACTTLLDCMGLGADAVIVIHVGGQYAEKQESLARFIHNLDRLSGAARRRLALENDDRLYDITDLIWLYKRTGLRIVFDVLHHRCQNEAALPLLVALEHALATWPADQQPKIHFSTSRTELRYLYQQGTRRLAMPLPNQHSDFINPFELIDLLHAVRSISLRSFDIMLEAKAKDLALLRLRAQIAQYAPTLVPVIA
jgi:UV DNA damage endonuclease